MKNKKVGFHGNTLSMKDAGGFNFTETAYDRGASMPAHSHPVPYISVVLSGSYRERIGSSVRACEAKDLVVHPEGETHSVTFLSTETRIMRIECSRSFRHRSDLRPTNSFKVGQGGNPVLGRIAAQLCIELRNRDRFSSFVIQGLMLEMLAELARSRHRSTRDASPENRMKRVEEYVRREFRNEVTLEKVAREIGVHPGHLSREFLRSKGIAFGDYLRQIRVDAACREIARGGKRLCDIAVDVGFYDQSHFSNTFRRIVGTTPSEYRRAILG